MESHLEVDSVIKSYGTRQILTDICLNCKTGEIIGLLGRNGLGKSTLLKIIFGTVRAENKFVRIDQKVLESPFHTMGLIQYLPQNSFLPSRLTVKQIVEMYLDKIDVDSLLDDPILQAVADTKVGNLSGGEGRYLEIKLLLWSEAKFVLLDEPFNGVSPLLVEYVQEIIRQQSHQKGIVLTDHNYKAVMEVANRYYLLYDGGLKRVEKEEDLVRWGYVRALRTPSH